MDHVYLSTICDNIGLCVFVLDDASKIIYTSWQAQALLHITTNNTLDEILDPSALFLCEESIKKLKEEKSLVSNKINFTLDEDIVSLNFRFFLIEDCVFVHVDITENCRPSHDSLLALEEKLSAVNRLSDGIAHNLKSPLMALRGISDYMVFLSSKWHRLMEKSCNDCPLHSDKAKVKELLHQMRDDIKNNVTVMTDIISHLRAYNKIDRINEFVTTNLEDLLQKTIKVMEYNTKLSVDISCVFSSKPVADIYCNPSDIQVVFTNIIENAIEQILYKEIKHGKIEIKVKKIPNGVIIKIKDNGGGIDPKLLETNSLFEPFITTKKNEGTGLGLHSSFKIIKEHRGNIYARNHKGKIGTGAEFVVILPVAQP